jgi:hypothetical protein
MLQGLAFRRQAPARDFGSERYSQGGVMRRLQHIIVAVLFLCGSVAMVIAQEMDRDRPEGMGQPEEVHEADIFGAELMTDQEIIDYRQNMQDLETEEDRERFHREHKEWMRERARLLGITLDEEPNSGTMPGPLRNVPDDRAQRPGLVPEEKP